ncbi:hypothetical protein SUGI_0275090, partial [Cryptomeria japonica]
DVKAKKKKDSLKTKMDGWNEDWNVAKVSNVNLETLALYDKQIELERTHSVSVVGGNNLKCKEAKSKLPSITVPNRQACIAGMRSVPIPEPGFLVN